MEESLPDGGIHRKRVFCMVIYIYVALQYVKYNFNFSRYPFPL
jgi:hypothetical protein